MARVSQSPNSSTSNSPSRGGIRIGNPLQQTCYFVSKICSGWILPQLILRLLLSRHEMSASCIESPSFSPKFPKELKETRVLFRYLLFTLVLLGGATPLHVALGVVPHCLPLTSQGATETADAKLPLSELVQVVPNYNAGFKSRLFYVAGAHAPPARPERVSGHSCFRPDSSYGC
jgi:hypothetical protein